MARAPGRGRPTPTPGRRLPYARWRSKSGGVKDMSRKPLVLVLVLGLAAATLDVAGQVSPAAAQPATVTLAGSFQQELGCPADWQPECPATNLALDAAGTENTGAGGVRDGPNIALDLAEPTQVKFFFDGASHWVTDNQTSVIATVPGSFQSELGCANDWDPGCLRSWLQDADGDGVGRFSTSALPPGTYEAKVAIDEAWDENYGAGGTRDGANIPFSVGSAGDVAPFSSAQPTPVPDTPVPPAEPVDDAALVREPVRHPFVDEMLYFAIPDRFNDGDPGNNCGDFAGTCVAGDTQENMLAHGYLPNQKGYYHGGDLAGLRRKLPYLQGLGVTAVWVGPIFTNNPTQSDTTDLYGHSAGYHGYWIEDFLNVDPPLGTHAEFARLVDDAHDRGMKVVMDIVTNHTADVIQLEGNAGYRNKRDFPYLDANGQPFDDSDFAYSGQPDYSFPEVNAGSFPYAPTLPPGEENAKNPAWLNDPFLYHNRGNTSFTGENSLYGDFFGLDDLWTERREVVEGMVDIYSFWIEEFGVDGFRIDTTKHVNMEFWQKFGPDILAAVDDRLRLPVGGAWLRVPERADRHPARLLRPRRLLHRRRQQRLRDADVPRKPRHGAHRLLPPAGRPGRRRRHRAAGPLSAGARPHVLRPRPARRLLRRRARLHGRRRRQGRPRGHVRQHRAVLCRQRPDRHRRDIRRRQLRLVPPALRDHPEACQALPAESGAAVRSADPPLQLRRARGLRILADRPRPARRVRGRAQQRRRQRHRRRADVFGRGCGLQARVEEVGVRPERADPADHEPRRRAEPYRAAARGRHLPGRRAGAGQWRSAG